MRKAVILAAGMGTRLRPLTDSEHKCMTKVCGVPIIKQTLMNLAKNRFEEVVIVVGYLRDKLMEEIKEMDCCLKILFAENGIYDQTNTTYSLKLGLETVGEFEELFVIEGDVFFEDAVITDISLVMPNAQDPSNSDKTEQFQVSLNYRKIVWEHVASGTSGSDDWRNA